MQRKNRKFIGTSKMKLSKSKLIGIQEADKAKIESLTPLIGTSIFLGLWVMLCYNNNMFLKEALTCSSIILGIVFLSSASYDKSLDQNIHK